MSYYIAVFHGDKAARIFRAHTSRGKEQHKQKHTHKHAEECQTCSHQMRLKYDGAFTMNMRLLLST